MLRRVEKCAGRGGGIEGNYRSTEVVSISTGTTSHVSWAVTAGEWLDLSRPKRMMHPKITGPSSLVAWLRTIVGFDSGAVMPQHATTAPCGLRASGPKLAMLPTLRIVGNTLALDVARSCLAHVCGPVRMLSGQITVARLGT